MFRKTRFRLVIFNFIVFFIILNGFGATLYFYMEHRMYKQVDERLQLVAERLQRDPSRYLSRPKVIERESGRRIVFVLWDNDTGQVRLQVPENFIYPEDLQKFRPETTTHSEQTVTIDSFSYRVYTIPEKNDSSNYTIQLIYNLQPEVEMLENLFFVIVITGIVSGIVAWIAGLVLANKALIPIQQAWNKQQQFVADASHELRTPLSVMKLHLEQLFRHPDHTIVQESERISQVIHETRRMSKMVEHLLILARSDSNQIQIMKQDVQLDQLLQQVVQHFKELANMKGIHLETFIESPIEMLGDRERLHQLFVILLDNALKYTEEKGTIRVSCFREGKHVKITVKDTGIGIPKKDLPLIFNRFFRGDKARNRTQVGTGLGLSIAKWIAESHEGKIQVESEVNVGTCVTVDLPLKRNPVSP